MRGFGLALAHAGYTAVLWDFSGHGANPQPLPADQSGSGLLQDAEMVLEQVQENGLLEQGGVAILGHSMGSGVALDFGVQHPETAATIAVSPVSREVSPQLPRSLLLMAGALEPRFAQNAETLLAEAGGPGGDPASGSGRKLIIIPGVEHISILFSPNAHHSAVEWLDAAFGVQPGAAPYSDRRIFWYLGGIIAVLLLSWSLAPLVTGLAGSSQAAEKVRTPRPLWQRLGALLAGVGAACLLLWVAGAAGLQLDDVFGLLIGGFILLWLAAAGVIAVLLQGGFPARLNRQQMISGVVVFAFLWLGVGLLGQMVWLHWLLIPARLVLWLLGSLLLLPWFLAVGEAAVRATGFARAGWWLAHSALLVGGLLLALSINPALGFLILILPLLPVLLALHALAAAPYRGSWAFTLSGAMFLSWTILAVFPLVQA
jgi:pimeloyl-ACP methyl ester carboxylesterase